VAGVCLAALYLANPGRSPLFPPCPFHKFTGLYCPGCGSLRALHHLLHGDVAGAMAMNALMVLSLPVLGAFLVRPAWTRKPWIAYAVLIVIIVYWIARNIPGAPFNRLAPG